MGANYSSSFKAKSGIPSSPPSCNKKSKKGERGSQRRRIILSLYPQPLPVMLRMSLQLLQVMLGAQV